MFSKAKKVIPRPFTGIKEEKKPWFWVSALLWVSWGVNTSFNMIEGWTSKMLHYWWTRDTRFFIRNMFIRNLRAESSKIKKLLLKIIYIYISISEIRNLFCAVVLLKTE